ncbi:MAG: methyltransferase domain-containing protein [Proteobacteria bacterium]|nr:methyltransferase domain-containing protein [Pseudomonadota bacterium]
MPFTERDTETFYDAHDSEYRSFWDSEGSLHWGLYEQEPEPDGSDYLAACLRSNQRLASALQPIGPDSHVLDLGCGNGNSALWLARHTGARVTGIDLSGVRVGHAIAAATRAGMDRVSFRKASATELPFESGTFTHVWSQATLYHVHDRRRALAEIARVLRAGGVFAFDDLVQPNRQVSALAQRYVYDRLLYGPTFSHDDYRAALAEVGLMPLTHADWSLHLRRSYQALAQRAMPAYPDLALAYNKMNEAIDLGDLGWSFFRALRVTDALDWVYDTRDHIDIATKYDAWAPVYEADVGRDYHDLVEAAACRFAKASTVDGGAVLDIGCGTGLVGAALSRHGMAALVGVDPSREMLVRCRTKGVYTQLHAAKVDELDGMAGLPAAAAIAVGVFTHGHAPLAHLPHAARAVQPGGVLGVVLREDIAASDAFPAALASMPARYTGRVPVGRFDGQTLDLHTWHRI